MKGYFISTNESTYGVIFAITALLLMTLVGMLEVPLNDFSYAQIASNNSSIAKVLTNNLTSNTTVLDTIEIPVSKGFVDGKIAYFISTDASNNQVISSVSNTTGFSVNYAPELANTSKSSTQQGYVFINGVKGEGPFGTQLSVASAIPGEEGYSPLFEINYVKWNSNSTNNRVLTSVDEILDAQNRGEVNITKSNIIINSPAVKMESNSSVNSNPNISKDFANVNITLSRGPCHGMCPVYSLEIDDNGGVIYRGYEYVKLTGEHTSSIPIPKVKELINKFYSSGFFELEDRYDQVRITDQPSAEISITIDGKTKSVYDYHGTFDSPKLEKLRNLENTIDEITNSSQWVGQTG
jgi:hypothetical protein